jgi:hypothetical protein
MSPTARVRLEFAPPLNAIGKKKQLRDGLSAVVQVGATLWVANDEALSLERLSFLGREGGDYRYGAHAQFPLADVLKLPVPPEAGEKPEEADLEGLDFDDGYLWLAGSHSLKRGNPDPDDPLDKNLERLAKRSRDGNRYLLARVPLVERDGAPVPVEQDGKRTAARLQGDAEGNELTDLLKDDPHLGPFLDIPGKDNGFDIEGLAVAGKRVFLGLRGPVLRGWAAVLELEPVADEDHPHRLKLGKFGPAGDEQPYRKHFLKLDGLGIRDLCVAGDDLLILAGPSMDLDGPVALFRWKGGAQPAAAGFVADPALERVRKLPYGRGVDHPEGLARFTPPGGGTDDLIVVCDAASQARWVGGGGFVADVFGPTDS